MGNEGTIARQVGKERIQSFAFVIGVVLCVFLCGFFVVWRFWRAGDSHEIQLSESINPNEAPVGSLVRLPGIGMGRAWAIVSYREGAFEEGRRPAFRNCSDLQEVSGIGPKTVESIGEWLAFE